MRHISLSVLFSYFCVFVIQPAFGLVGVVTSLLPGRTLAAESEVIYNQMVQKYGVDKPDDDVATEDKLTTIKQKYGKGGTGGTDVLNGLVKYQGQDQSAPIDMSRYQTSGANGTDFNSRYKNAYGEVSGGGVGMGKVQMPGVSSGNVSVNYSSSGGSQVKRNADGTISSTALNNATTHQSTRDQMVGAEADHTETKFDGNKEYNPKSDEELVKTVKGQMTRGSYGKTSDSVAYRTIMKTYTDNKPQNISRDNSIFDASKGIVTDALNPQGNFLGSCTNHTTSTVVDKYYPDWSEHRCSVPKRDNYQTCTIHRTVKSPIEVVPPYDNIELRSCGTNCMQVYIRDYFGVSGSCNIKNYHFGFIVNPGYKITNVTRANFKYDDWVVEKLNGTVTNSRVPAGNDALVFSGGCENSGEIKGGGEDETGLFTSVAAGAVNTVDIHLAAGGDNGLAYLVLNFTFDQDASITSEVTQEPPGCADAIGWHADNNPESCAGSTDAGCQKPIKTTDGICQADAWVATDVGTHGLSSALLDSVPPLFPGDSAKYTWSANANGYFCDPLKKNKICVDEAGTQCYDYEQIKNLPDGCAQYASNPQCVEESRECVEGWKDPNTGACYMQEVVYKCDSGRTVSQVVNSSSNTCGTLPCIGTDCNVGEQEKNQDFAKTAGLLNAVSFMSADGECNLNDPTKCKVFQGEQKYCGWAVGVVGSLAKTNCCEEPEGGPSMVSASMAAFSVIRSMNWQTVAQSAVDVTGSTSWYDIYYTADGYASWVGKSFSMIGNTVTNAANSVINSVVGETTSAVGSDVAQKVTIDGMMEAAKQKIYSGLYNMLGGSQGIGGAIFDDMGAQGLQLSQSALMVCQALNVVMIAYTVYKITVMIAQMIAACKPEEMETASKIHEKACFTVGSTYCLKKVLGGCAKRAQNYCCYSSMLPRIVMQQAVKQLNLTDCSGITVAQLQQLDWSKIDLSEWVAEASLDGVIPDGADDLTLEALTGSGHAYANGGDRDTTLERLNGRFDTDKLVNAGNAAQGDMSLENVDCSYLPRPAICKFQE